MNHGRCEYSPKACPKDGRAFLGRRAYCAKHYAMVKTAVENVIVKTEVRNG